MASKKILIIYYSYSSQTRKLVHAFGEGLESENAEVSWLQVKTRKKLSFPLGSVWATCVMMLMTFLRRRYPISPVRWDERDYDLIVLAGPTWSYNPSGPILDFFDKYGMVFSGQRVLPLISCRGYWRSHYYQLRYMLKRRHAHVMEPLVFLHTGPEPWRTIGVFLKLAGKVPESGRSWISRYYQKFGHTRGQVQYAHSLGARVAQLLCLEKPLQGLERQTIGDIGDEISTQKVSPPSR